jgi:hypothetical protein
VKSGELYIQSAGYAGIADVYAGRIDRKKLSNDFDYYSVVVCREFDDSDHLMELV